MHRAAERIVAALPHCLTEQAIRDIRMHLACESWDDEAVAELDRLTAEGREGSDDKRARWATRARCPRTFWDGFTHKNPPHKPGPDCVDRCEFTDIAGPGDICICKACNPAKVIRKGRMSP